MIGILLEMQQDEITSRPGSAGQAARLCQGVIGANQKPRYKSGPHAQTSPSAANHNQLESQRGKYKDGTTIWPNDLIRKGP